MIKEIKFYHYFSLGTKSLQEILSDRESIAQTMQVDYLKLSFQMKKNNKYLIQAALDEGTECWGVRVERVEV